MIQYKKAARGTILAKGRMRRPATEVLQEFNDKGDVAYTVDVTLENEKGDTVAEMEVGWRVKRIVCSLFTEHPFQGAFWAAWEQITF